MQFSMSPQGSKSNRVFESFLYSIPYQRKREHTWMKRKKKSVGQTERQNMWNELEQKERPIKEMDKRGRWQWQEQDSQENIVHNKKKTKTKRMKGNKYPFSWNGEERVRMSVCVCMHVCYMSKCCMIGLWKNCG